MALARHLNVPRITADRNIRDFGTRLNDGTRARLGRSNLTGRKQATFFKPGVRNITPDFLAWQLNNRQAQQCSAAYCNVSQNQIRNAFDGSKRVALSEANSRKIVETCQARAEVDKYAHLASQEEIRENDFNLNTPATWTPSRKRRKSLA